MGEYVKTKSLWKFRKDGVGYVIFEHRKVWIEHNGEIPKGHVIHHINGDKHDNRIENLECISIKEHGLKHKKDNRIRIKYPSGAVKVIKK